MNKLATVFLFTIFVALILPHYSQAYLIGGTIRGHTEVFDTQVYGHSIELYGPSLWGGKYWHEITAGVVDHIDIFVGYQGNLNDQFRIQLKHSLEGPKDCFSEKRSYADWGITASTSLVRISGFTGSQCYIDSGIQQYWYFTPPFSNKRTSSRVGISGDTLFLFLRAYTATSSDELPPKEPECCSSVLFLPGIMGSTLHENGQKLWEPGSEDDVGRLYMDESGNSINDIEVGEVIETFDGPATFNVDIYKSFLDGLSEKKSAGFISDYSAYSYDWRKSLEDILVDSSLESELFSLASTSKTGKVTIIAHSNGRLLAKALINKLGVEAASLVDQIILVGVPQLGTPQAIGALLHGYDSGIPLRYSPALARDFALNAPFAYNLLPHYDYHSSAGVSVDEPLITFDSGEATQAFIDAYGYSVTNNTELINFLLGIEGREVPSFDDLLNLTKANATLLSDANDEYANIDSSWLPPSGIKVHQIAGTGVLTTAGIKYSTVKDCLSTQINSAGVWSCDYSGRDKLAYSPVRVWDGDKTVIEPSALMMSDSSDITRWWVDLKDYNNDNPSFGVFKKEHKNLLEVQDVTSFIFNNLLATSTETYTYISDSKPALLESNRLSFTLHSPLTLSYTESDGTVVSEENPYGNYSEYNRYGEVQIIDVFEEKGQGTVVINGTATGSFTLEIEEVSGEVLASEMVYSGIPSATSSIVTLEVSGTSAEDLGPLRVDFDGDEQVDFILVGENDTINTMSTTSMAIENEVGVATSSNSTNVSSGGSSRSTSKPIPQVAGVSINSDIATVAILVQLLIKLESMKGDIDALTYNLINQKARLLIGDILKRYAIYN